MQIVLDCMRKYNVFGQGRHSPEFEPAFIKQFCAKRMLLKMILLNGILEHTSTFGVF